MTLLLLSTLMILSVTVLTIESILTMGSILIIAALISTLLLTKIMGSWFAFILFLQMKTILFQLFAYMIAMSPNTHKPTMTMKKFMIIMLLPSVMMLMKTKFSNMKTPNTNLKLSITSLCVNMNMLMYWTMAITLFLALVMVVMNKNNMN
nr:NADH dehydrogenase subunit 6 [Cupuladria biporosa]